MAACVILLSGLFAKNIYFMSSLFLGLTLCSVPFIVSADAGDAEKSSPCATVGSCCWGWPLWRP